MNFLVAAIAGLMMTAEMPSNSSTLVATGCVGECGTRDKVVFVAPELGTDVTFSLEVLNYDLCPSDIAGVMVTVDGKPYGRVNLADKAMHLITVAPGSMVELTAGTKTIHPTIRCVELGTVEFGVYMR